MGSSRSARFPRLRWAALVVVALVLIPGLDAADLPRPDDDATYRPTVMVRRGKSLGSGTIIASVHGETLILTASHVIQGDGPIAVELHRYNLGVEHVQAIQGFPKRIEAQLLARDQDGDLAILQIKGHRAFPYIARIAKGEGTPAPGSVVTTIGFDRGAKLIGFVTRVKKIDEVNMGQGGGFRRFIATEDPPEVGRSGGGLFRSDGMLVGVCVARAEPRGGRTIGLFSTLENVRALIRSDEAIEAAVARAVARPRSPTR